MTNDVPADTIRMDKSFIFSTDRVDGRFTPWSWPFAERRRADSRSDLSDDARICAGLLKLRTGQVRPDGCRSQFYEGIHTSRRLRRETNSEPKTTPAQAPSASTMKSLKRACLPGTTSCESSKNAENDIARVQIASRVTNTKCCASKRNIAKYSKLWGAPVTGCRKGGAMVRTTIVTAKARTCAILKRKKEGRLANSFDHRSDNDNRRHIHAQCNGTSSQL